MLEFLFPFLGKGTIEGLYLLNEILGFTMLIVGFIVLLVAVLSNQHDPEPVVDRTFARIGVLLMMLAPFLTLAGLLLVLLGLALLAVVVYVIVKGFRLAL